MQFGNSWVHRPAIAAFKKYRGSPVSQEKRKNDVGFWVFVVQLGASWSFLPGFLVWLPDLILTNQRKRKTGKCLVAWFLFGNVFIHINYKNCLLGGRSCSNYVCQNHMWHFGKSGNHIFKAHLGQGNDWPVIQNVLGASFKILGGALHLLRWLAFSGHGEFRLPQGRKILHLLILGKNCSMLQIQKHRRIEHLQSVGSSMASCKMFSFWLNSNAYRSTTHLKLCAWILWNLMYCCQRGCCWPVLAQPSSSYGEQNLWCDIKSAGKLTRWKKSIKLAGGGSRVQKVRGQILGFCSVGTLKVSEGSMHVKTCQSPKNMF